MANKKLEKQAAAAAEALKDAQKNQAQGKFDQAAEDIEKARQALGKSKESEENKANKESGKDQDKSAENQSGKDQDSAAGGEQRENQMDNKQTNALLDSMSQDEKALRDAIKSNRRNRRIRPVEKDW